VLQLEARRSITLAAGASGTGKTTFALRSLVADRSLACRFLFDAEGEFARRLGLTPAETTEELACSLEDGFTVFDPHRLFPGRLAAAFDWFCTWCFNVSGRLGGPKVLLVDEAWKYCSPHSIPFSMANCIQTGRKHGLGMIFATQRPNKLNEAITNEVTECVCFRLQGGNALRRVEELGADPSEVAGLAPGAFVSVNVQSGQATRGRLW